MTAHPSIRAGRPEKVGDAARRADGYKRRAYAKRTTIPVSALLPLAFETSGYLHPANERMLKRIIRGCHVGGLDNAGNTFSDNYDKVRAHMSVALQRGNAALLIHYRQHMVPM